MEIKLQDYKQNTESINPNNLGKAQVSLDGKVVIWMNVLKGNKGIFLKFPSVKIDGEFHAAISWLGQNMESRIREAIMPDLEQKINFPLAPAPQIQDTMEWL